MALIGLIGPISLIGLRSGLRRARESRAEHVLEWALSWRAPLRVLTLTPTFNAIGTRR